MGNLYKLEKQVRDTDTKHKKKSLRLTKLVDYLLEKERYLEAKFYFEQLFKLKPDSLSTAILGMKVSTATFDSHRARQFNETLFKLKYDSEKHRLLLLSYFYAVHDISKCIEVFDLLSQQNKLSNETIDKMYDITVNNTNYALLAVLLKILKRNKKVLNNRGSNHLRPIAITELLNTIVRVANNG
ncbi:hypothetical protein [Vibrio rotiferianus]|uniref:hypothetical protein n=1 Tax=Vibrio rotiferianus TaxID=190895 RepID=UPI0005EF62C5|nr:hypothetical protein [Vibrio rotiferianus]